MARFVLGHYRYKYGISIPPDTKIGSGFYIGHFGGIVVNSNCVIGNNCNISQGVSLGKANRGKNKGFPVLGNNIYIGPGAKIVGAVRIGDNVAIGANCVVTKNIPNNSVVVGIPGRVISSKGAEGYVNRTDYDEKIY
jgi:serine O-acetyltransferase